MDTKAKNLTISSEKRVDIARITHKLNMKPHTPILLALQYCHKDADAAFSLARLIVDLQPEYDVNTEFVLFHSRKQDEPNHNSRAAAVSQILATKFKTIVMRCERFAEGYPDGSNDMWHDLIQRVYLMKREGNIKAECFLSFEADCIPTRPTWIEELADEWTLARDNGKSVIGACHDDHVNGNLVADVNLCQMNANLIGSAASAPWDMYHGKYLLSIAQPTGLIVNDYRKPTITEDEVFSPRKFGKSKVAPAMIHGVRDDSGLKLVRKKFLG